MAKTISFGLSVSEINRAIRELEQYKKDLEKKVEVFTYRLSKLGLDNIKVIMQGVPSTDEAGEWEVNLTHSASNGVAQATISLSGTQILFIEFGTGIRYVNPVHPQKAIRGYHAGSFGKGQGRNPRGWYYKDRAGLRKHSYGNVAHMPMCASSVRMKTQISKIAREVFGS